VRWLYGCPLLQCCLSEGTLEAVAQGRVQVATAEGACIKAMAGLYALNAVDQQNKGSAALKRLALAETASWEPAADSLLPWLPRAYY